MQKIRVFASIKPPWVIPTTSLEKVLCNEITRDRWLVASPATLLIPTFRSIHFTRAMSTVTVNEVKKNIVLRMLYKLGFPEPGKYKRKMMGYLLYEDLVNSINFTDFFKEFKLPDTFYSWFVIMELHTWMLMIRYMAEGKKGHDVRNSIVEAMWADVNKRKSKLQNANVSALKKQYEDLSQQFNAAIIGYDEGIMSDDKVLAGALWRRFFQSECNNPEDLEKLVVYVRKQVNELDRMSSEECMSKTSIQWIRHEKS